jgi:phage repressor protein C with HTH and peptisase S24 domain
VVGLTKAGSSGFFDDCGFPTGGGFKKLHRPNFVKDPNAYALIVDGDSMTPRVRKGEVVMVEPERHTPVNGDLVVVRLKSGEVMLKEIYYQDGIVVLKSTNQTYDPIAVKKNEIDFCHKVVLIKPK